MFKRGFYFKTKNGTVYYYNDNDGAVTIPKNIENKTKSCLERVRQPAQRLQVNSRYKIEEITAVKHFVEDKGYSQLILVITHDCDLRCRYCVYSGSYKNMRTHGISYMTVDVARKAIKRYFEGFIPVKQKNPYKIPVIGFYGGEPLMAFDLIEKTVEYARVLYPGKIYFSLTTNGTILTNKIIDFFRSNDFILSISLNGPQTEHDRLRIFPDGTGSFNIVWDNLLKIREKYSNRYRKRCNLLVCYDAGTDFEAVTNFFESNKDVLPSNMRVSEISPYFTDWYDQYSIQQKTESANSLKVCKEKYFVQLIKGEKPLIFFEALFGMAYRMVLNRPQNISSRPYFLPYTATCIPGDKIAVDPQGNFHCCERINEQFPLGDIKKGLDMEKITNMIVMYRKQIYPECLDCPVDRLCSLCYAVVAGNGKFERNPSNLCANFQRNVKEKFVDLWTLFEAGVKESEILKVSTNTFLDI